MRYDAVIFDLDGTLLATLGDLTSAVNKALEHNGLEPIVPEQVLGFIGNGSHKLIERAIGGRDADVDKVHAEYKQFYLECCTDNTVPYPGIPELLKHLRDCGVKVCCNTNKPHEAASKVLEHCLGGLIDIIAAQSETIPRKPDPTGVKYILDNIGIAPDRCCYVGDSDVDIRTAANAGIDVISVDWGFRPHELLVQSGAKVICSDVSSLQEQLCK